MPRRRPVSELERFPDVGMVEVVIRCKPNGMRHMTIENGVPTVCCFLALLKKRVYALQLGGRVKTLAGVTRCDSLPPAHCTLSSQLRLRRQYDRCTRALCYELLDDLCFLTHALLLICQGFLALLMIPLRPPRLVEIVNKQLSLLWGFRASSSLPQFSACRQSRMRGRGVPRF